MQLFLFCFNPTTKAVTFHHRRRCMLGVLLLPAFTHLGHECQDLLSLCNGMHVCTNWTSVYTLIERVLGNEVRTQVNSKGKIPSTTKFTLPVAQRRVEPPTLHHTGQQAQHTTD